MFYALAGSWEAVWEGASYPVTLPGTLDENNIGYADSGEDQRLPPGERKGGGAPIAGRVVDWQPPQGRRVFFQVGRARHLRLLVDGQEVAPFEEPTISTPYVFEVTGLVKPGSQVELISDNSYPGWPHDAIVYSSAATDETQTNWNGVLGDLGLRDEAPVFLRSVRVYPGEETLSVQVEVSAAHLHGPLRSWDADELLPGRGVPAGVPGPGRRRPALGRVRGQSVPAHRRPQWQR